MSGKGSLVNFLSEEDRKRLLNFRPASELKKIPKKDTPRASVPAAGPQLQSDSSNKVTEAQNDQTKPTLPEACEFVCGQVFEGSSGRRCVDGTFCPARIFGNLSIFQVCSTRLKKLKEQKKEQT